jgi:hypothetical protein
MFVKDKIDGWIAKWKGTNVWVILTAIRTAWNKLAGLGLAPSETNGPGGDGGMQGPK